MKNELDASGPLVSIGIPVYNGGRYLRQTLASILEQTYENFEIVVSDNCSTDDTCDIVQELCSGDGRVRLWRNSENQGAAANYNRVFDLSTGKYFKWAAADDLLAPNYVESCVRALEASGDHVLAFPRTEIIDGDGATVERINETLDLSASDPVIRYMSLRRTLRECNAVFGLIRSDILRRTYLIQSFAAADVHLLAELSLYGKFALVPDFLFFRRNHAAASSADKSESAQADFYDPRRHGRPLISMWRGLIQDLSALGRCPIPKRKKLRLSFFLVNKMRWGWRTYIRELWFYTRYAVRRRNSSGHSVS